MTELPMTELMQALVPVLGRALLHFLWQGAVIGVIGSILITFTSWRAGLVNSVFYQTIAISSCVICGYLGSLCFRKPEQSLLGLTVYDRKPD